MAERKFPEFFESLSRISSRILLRTSEVNKRGRPSKWPPSVFPQNLQILSVRFPCNSLEKIWLPKTPFWRRLSGTNSGVQFALVRLCSLPRTFPEFFKGIFVLRFPGNGDQKKFTEIPALFQSKIARQIRKKNSHNVSGEQAK